MRDAENAHEVANRGDQLLAVARAQQAAAKRQAELISAQRRAIANDDEFGDWCREITPTYTWDWPYLKMMRERLNKITTGVRKKQIIMAPVRVGKTEQNTIRYAVWRMKKDPTLRVCIGAYSQEFAAELGRKARNIARRAGINISTERSAAKEWQTLEGGIFRSCGVGSPPTGQGFNLLIIEDFFRKKKEADSLVKRDEVYSWYSNDLTTRLEPGAGVLIVATPWHVDDVIHRIIKSEDAPEWDFLRLPSEAEENDPLGRAVGEPLCPARFPKKTLEARKRVLGSRQYAAMFQCRPKMDEGSLFQRKWIEPNRCIIDHDQLIFPDGLHVLLHECPAIAIVDPAMGGRHSDDTGIGAYLFAGERIVVLRSIGRRIPIESLSDEVEWWARDWYPRYAGVEANGFQRQVVKEIREKVRIPVKELDPAGESKKSRAYAATVMAEEGRIYWLDNGDEEDDWYEKWMTELENFTGEGDEQDAQVDTLAYAVLEYEQMQGILDDPGPVVFGGANRMIGGEVVQGRPKALPAFGMTALQRWQPGSRGGSVG